VWQVHPDELGVRVTTDPTDIATFLKGDGRCVVFGTYASSARIAEAQADPSVPAFDLVVADEAHRVAGITSRGNRTKRDTKVVIDDERIRARRRLFATATPRVYTKSRRTWLESLDYVEFASMDDVEHFGVEAHRLWFRRAVELERLVDYRLSVVVVTDAEVEELIRERAWLDVQGRRFDAETLAALIAVRRAVDELGVRRVITFHHTIDRAKRFANELEKLELDAPAVAARHVSGSMSLADRQRVLASLQDPEQPTVVTNARCLTEGIDVPALGAVVFVDPRSAAVDIVQAVGRVMRIAKGKELGHVVVPVLLNDEQRHEPVAAIESSAFEPVLAVLRALLAHDPELATDATRIATSASRRDAVVGGYISKRLDVLGVDVDVREFEQALGLRFAEVAADRWGVGLASLLEDAVALVVGQFSGLDEVAEARLGDAPERLVQIGLDVDVPLDRGALGEVRTPRLVTPPSRRSNA
jgi:predicted helicase